MQVPALLYTSHAGILQDVQRIQNERKEPETTVTNYHHNNKFSYTSPKKKISLLCILLAKRNFI